MMLLNSFDWSHSNNPEDVIKMNEWGVDAIISDKTFKVPKAVRLVVT
jgi:hypothetical protein